jgi:hypothetical protein
MEISTSKLVRVFALDSTKLVVEVGIDLELSAREMSKLASSEEGYYALLLPLVDSGDSPRLIGAQEAGNLLASAEILFRCFQKHVADTTACWN